MLLTDNPHRPRSTAPPGLNYWGVLQKASLQALATLTCWVMFLNDCQMSWVNLDAFMRKLFAGKRSLSNRGHAQVIRMTS